MIKMSNEQDMSFEAMLNNEIQVAEELISKQALYMRFFQMNGNFKDKARSYEELASHQMARVEEIYFEHYGIKKPFKDIFKEYRTSLEAFTNGNNYDLQEGSKFGSR